MADLRAYTVKITTPVGDTYAWTYQATDTRHASEQFFDDPLIADEDIHEIEISPLRTAKETTEGHYNTDGSWTSFSPMFRDLTKNEVEHFKKYAEDNPPPIDIPRLSTSLSPIPYAERFGPPKMATRRFCDRCDRQLKTTTDMKHVTMHNDLVRKDLCNRCYNKLLDWLKNDGAA